MRCRGGNLFVCVCEKGTSFFLNLKSKIFQTLFMYLVCGFFFLGCQKAQV